MSWKLHDRPKTVKVTSKLAKEFAEMEAVPRDRPLSERRLQVYSRLLKDGQFRPVTWARAYCVETGQTYRVNGKHTSMMLSGMEVVPEFYVTIEDYHCETLQDVAELYATFDSKMMSRTNKDINLSFAGTINELKDLPARIINISVSGMSYHTWQEAYGTIQPAERAELLIEYPDFVIWVANFFGGDRDETRLNSKHLFRMSVVAAVFGSWKKAKADCYDFWSAVRDETGNSPTLPDRKLARYLHTTAVRSGLGASKVRVADAREIYVKCIHAWNAWRADENTNLNYRVDAKVPAMK